jgi:hypothetical protein
MIEGEGEFGFILKVCQGTARTSTHINTLCHNSGALPFFVVSAKTRLQFWVVSCEIRSRKVEMH